MLDSLTIATQGLLADVPEIALQGLLAEAVKQAGGGLWDWDWHEKRRKRAEEERLRRAREELGIIPPPRLPEPDLPEEIETPKRRTLSLNVTTPQDDALVSSLRTAIGELQGRTAREQESRARDRELIVERRKRRTLEAARLAETIEQKRLADIVEQKRLRREMIERDDLEVITLLSQFM